VTQRPISWTQNSDPASIVGDFNDPATHTGQQWVPSVTLQVDGRIDAFAPMDDRAGVVLKNLDSTDPRFSFRAVPVPGTRTGLVQLLSGSDCLAVNGNYAPIAGASMVVT